MTKKQKKIPKVAGKRRAALVTAIMLFALALGTWLALSPTLEKQQALTRQEELLDSIEQGDGVIVLDESFAGTGVDFYDEPEAEQEAAAQAGPAVVSTDGNTAVTGLGVLTIERIGAKLPVTDGVSAAQLKVAVGHVPQTAPIGETGNAVIAGHRSYTYGHFFNRLGELAVGDLIRYTPRDGEPMEFTVYEILETPPDD